MSVKDYTMKLLADVSSLEKDLKSAEKKYDQYYDSVTSEDKKSKAEISKLQDQMAQKLSKLYDNLTADAKKTADESTKAFQNELKSVEKGSKQAYDIRKKYLDQYKKQIDDAIKKEKQLGEASGKKGGGGKDGLGGKALEETGEALSEMGGQFGAVAKKLGPWGMAVGAAVGVVAGVGKAMYSAAEASAAYQKSLAGVQTATGMTTEETKAFGTSLLDLDRPASVTAEGLGQIASTVATFTTGSASIKTVTDQVLSLAKAFPQADPQAIATSMKDLTEELGSSDAAFNALAATATKTGSFETAAESLSDIPKLLADSNQSIEQFSASIQGAGSKLQDLRSPMDKAKSELTQAWDNIWLGFGDSSTGIVSSTMSVLADTLSGVSSFFEPTEVGFQKAIDSATNFNTISKDLQDTLANPSMNTEFQLETIAGKLGEISEVSPYVADEVSKVLANQDMSTEEKLTKVNELLQGTVTLSQEMAQAASLEAMNSSVDMMNEALDENQGWWADIGSKLVYLLGPIGAIVAGVNAIFGDTEADAFEGLYTDIEEAKGSLEGLRAEAETLNKGSTEYAENLKAQAEASQVLNELTAQQNQLQGSMSTAANATLEAMLAQNDASLENVSQQDLYNTLLSQAEEDLQESAVYQEELKAIAEEIYAQKESELTLAQEQLTLDEQKVVTGIEQLNTQDAITFANGATKEEKLKILQATKAQILADKAEAQAIITKLEAATKGTENLNQLTAEAANLAGKYQINMGGTGTTNAQATTKSIIAGLKSAIGGMDKSLGAIDAQIKGLNTATSKSMKAGGGAKKSGGGGGAAKEDKAEAEAKKAAEKLARDSEKAAADAAKERERQEQERLKQLQKQLDKEVELHKQKIQEAKDIAAIAKQRKLAEEQLIKTVKEYAQGLRSETSKSAAALLGTVTSILLETEDQKELLLRRIKANDDEYESQVANLNLSSDQLTTKIGELTTQIEALTRESGDAAAAFSTSKRTLESFENALERAEKMTTEGGSSAEAAYRKLNSKGEKIQRLIDTIYDPSKKAGEKFDDDILKELREESGKALKISSKTEQSTAKGLEELRKLSDSLLTGTNTSTEVAAKEEVKATQTTTGSAEEIARLKNEIKKEEETKKDAEAAAKDKAKELADANSAKLLAERQLAESRDAEVVKKEAKVILDYTNALERLNFINTERQKIDEMYRKAAEEGTSAAESTELIAKAKAAAEKLEKDLQELGVTEDALKQLLLDRNVQIKELLKSGTLDAKEFKGLNFEEALGNTDRYVEGIKKSTVTIKEHQKVAEDTNAYKLAREETDKWKESIEKFQPEVLTAKDSLIQLSKSVEAIDLSTSEGITKAQTIALKQVQDEIDKELAVLVTLEKGTKAYEDLKKVLNELIKAKVLLTGIQVEEQKSTLKTTETYDEQVKAAQGNLDKLIPIYEARLKYLKDIKASEEDIAAATETLSGAQDQQADKIQKAFQDIEASITSIDDADLGEGLAGITEGLKQLQKEGATTADKIVGVTKIIAGGLEMAMAAVEQFPEKMDEIKGAVKEGGGKGTEAIGSLIADIGKALMKSGVVPLQIAGAVLLVGGMITKIVGKIIQKIKAMKGEEKSALEIAEERLRLEESISAQYDIQKRKLQDIIDLGNKQKSSATEQLLANKRLHDALIAQNRQRREAAAYDDGAITNAYERNALAVQEAQDAIDILEAKDDLSNDEEDRLDDLKAQLANAQRLLGIAEDEIEYRKTQVALQRQAREEFNASLALQERLALRQNDYNKALQKSANLMNRARSAMSDALLKELGTDLTGKTDIQIFDYLSTLSTDTLKALDQETQGYINSWLDAWQEFGDKAIADEENLIELRKQAGEMFEDGVFSKFSETEATEHLIEMYKDELDRLISIHATEEEILEIKIKIKELEEGTNDELSEQQRRLAKLVRERQKMLELQRSGGASEGQVSEITTRIRAELQSQGMSSEQIEAFIATLPKRAKGGPINEGMYYTHDNEYVLNEEAVNKYGSSFLNRLNSLSVPVPSSPAMGELTGAIMSRNTGQSIVINVDVSNALNIPKGSDPAMVSDMLSKQKEALYDAINKGIQTRKINLLSGGRL